MAAIVRVKRKVSEDPANSLLLSCKRLKTDSINESSDLIEDEEIKRFFTFAGTVSTKDEVVTSHVKEAIKREKLQRAYKLHNVDIGEKARLSMKKATSVSRFKVISSHRAKTLESLDTDKTDVKVSDGSENKEHKNDSLHKNDSETITETLTNNTGDSASKDKDSLVAASQSDLSREPGSSSVQDATPEDSLKSEIQAMYCLYDVEQESLDRENKPVPAQPETITCNGIAMVREKAPAKPITASSKNPAQYVYDIYYMNSRDFDFRALENILAIEAFQEEFVHPGVAEEEDLVYGEDEDSNDEDNWRNDYPDEDPRIYDENFEGQGFHQNHLPTRHTDSTEYDIADAMGHRLKICDDDDGDDLSSEDEQDFVYFNQPLDGASLWKARTSYDSYRRRILKELKQDYGEDDDDDDDKENDMT